MKNKPLQNLLLALILSLGYSLTAQSPLDVEQYQLDNGLTVYLNPDSTATKMFGAVAVKAGSKDDPAQATGIAHYLEHLLFKGTDSLGTWNYEKERVHLDSITELYRQLGRAQSPEDRNRIQRQINEQSVAASAYGLPNEFDRLLKSMGATNVNAFTTPDMTFYYNDFPANQTERWLELFAHRFRNPVFRSFQSELEVVYEEKNRDMDNFTYRFEQDFNRLMFEPHPYGTQSTLGKVEHLKNPSLDSMYAYFKRYYIPNNMALILSGDFDPRDVRPWIRRTFGPMPPGPEPPRVTTKPATLSGRKQHKVRYTPVPAAVYGFPTPGANHPDQAALDVISELLSNPAETGLLDRLGQRGKLTHVEAFNFTHNDAGGTVLVAIPKVFLQSRKRAEHWIMRELDKLKQGEISEKALAAAKHRLSRSFLQRLEQTGGRGRAIGYSFSRGQDWEEYLAYAEKVRQVDMEDIGRLSRKYYGDDFVYIKSGIGFPKKEKLSQPYYQPLQAAKDKKSPYAERFEAQSPNPVEADFLDFEKDAEYVDLGENNRLYVTPNPINDIFSLTIKYPFGESSARDLSLATKLMRYAGTAGRPSYALKQDFGAMGCEYGLSSNHNYLTLTLKGPDENLPQALALLREWVRNPVVDDKALKLLAKQARNRKQMEKRDPGTIGVAMAYYALFGEKSPYLRRHRRKEIKRSDAGRLLEVFRNATHYAADIHYVGGLSATEVRAALEEHYVLDESGRREQLRFPEPAQYKRSHIYFIHDEKAIQSQVYFYVPGEAYEKEELAAIQAFNAYFGGGFSGLVLQEVREYRSLAYSAWGRYRHKYKEGNRGYLLGYLGCQADKTATAVEVMLGLIQNLPEKPERISDIRTSLQQKALSAKPGFRERSEKIVSYRRQGYREDPLALAHADYESLEFEDILKFHKRHIQGRPVVITIYGDKKRMDMQKLEKIFGKLEFLKIKDVMSF